MEKSDKSKSSHESIDQLAMDIIHIKYQSIWNRLQVNKITKWTYWEFNYVSKTPQTLFPLRKIQKRKTQHWERYLMPYLHNGSTLEHNSNWFGKRKWSPTTFVFSIFRDWSWDQQPNNPWHGPWHTESSWYYIS